MSNPDAHRLFREIAERLNARAPAVPFADICAEFGMEEAELCRFILHYREKDGHRTSLLPPPAPVLSAIERLKERESSLVTILDTAPRQLEQVRRQIATLERRH